MSVENFNKSIFRTKQTLERLQKALWDCNAEYGYKVKDAFPITNWIEHLEFLIMEVGIIAPKHEGVGFYDFPITKENRLFSFSSCWLSERTVQSLLDPIVVSEK